MTKDEGVGERDMKKKLISCRPAGLLKVKAKSTLKNY